MARETVGIDEERRLGEFFSYFPKEPPTEEEVDAWVRQSIHQSARSFADRVVRETLLVQRFGAHIFTRSPVASEFLGLVVPTVQTGSVPAHTARTVIDLAVPF